MRMLRYVLIARIYLSFLRFFDFQGQYVDGLRAPFLIHPPKEVYSYDEEYTVVLGDWYHTEHHVLLKQFLSIANPGGAEPVPGRILRTHARRRGSSVDQQMRASSILRKTRHTLVQKPGHLRLARVLLLALTKMQPCLSSQGKRIAYGLSTLPPSPCSTSG